MAGPMMPKAPLRERVRQLDKTLPPALKAVLTYAFGMVKESDRLIKRSKPAEIALHYVELRQFRDQLDELCKIITQDRDRLAYEVIPRVFLEEGLTTCTLEEGYRVTISPLVRASVKEGQRDRAHDWLRKTGHGELIQPTINASTLSAFAKEMMEEKNEELPADIFNVHFGKNTSVTKVPGR